MALVSAQRAQTLHLLDIQHMKLTKNIATFRIISPLKQCRPGISTPVIEFKAYAPDRRLCVVTYIKEYLKRTKIHRNNSNQFFLSYSRRREPICKTTISRWIKTTLQRAGIQDGFNAHSTRAAATSSAYKSNLPVEDILKKAGWSSDSTFARYYNKPVRKIDLADAVLRNA